MTLHIFYCMKFLVIQQQQQQQQKNTYIYIVFWRIRNMKTYFLWESYSELIFSFIQLALDILVV